jgi:uncharacterized repeat protein (TIGR03803 family)
MKIRPVFFCRFPTLTFGIMKTRDIMKTQLTTLHNGSRTYAMIGPVLGRKPVLGLLIRLLWAAALVPPTFGAQAGVVFTSLHSFQVFYNGENPYAGLVQGSDGNFYGTTYQGGTNGAGTVFKISTNGALTSLYSFTGGNDGRWPTAGLVQGSDGNSYGTTSEGGTNGSGTVFKISTNGVLASLYSFTGGNDGAYPNAGLVQGSDGNFYGTTANGGGGGAGTVFRLTVAPGFQAVTLTNGTLSLTWSTEAGGTYQLQYNSDLSSSNWASLGSAVTATGATLRATDSVTNRPQRFYRVMLSP